MKKSSLRIAHNQSFEHRVYNIPLCSEKCSTSEICCKPAIEGRFEKFTINFQATNTLPNQPKTTGNGSYSIKHKFINLLYNHVLYLFNMVKGKCMSIVYQFDCYCITNRFLLDIFCNTKRIHFTECKSKILQSDFPRFSRDRV